ncbi:MAG: hypothetical protein HC804_06445 [Anaerolineae bacterium]|nr:hypothetical protein [Anaerolineae bacterium]
MQNNGNLADHPNNTQTYKWEIADRTLTSLPYPDFTLPKTAVTRPCAKIPLFN